MTLIWTRLLVVALFCGWTIQGHGQAFNIFEQSQQRLQSQYHQEVSDATFLTLRAGNLTHLHEQKLQSFQLNLPTRNNDNLELQLQQVHILSSDFVLSTSDGQQFSLEDTEGLFYHGHIKGNNNSSVALTVFEDKVRALITTNRGNFVLAALPQSEGQYIFYNDKNLNKNPNFDCGVTDQFTSTGQQIENQVNTDSRMTNCVEVYIEADNAMYQDHGSNLSNVEQYIMSLFNEIAVLYSNENINIQLSELHVWTQTDPYASFNSTLDVLNAFGQQTQDNYNGRLAHLISTRTLGGGIAWVDVLCNTYSTQQADLDGDGVPETYHVGPYAFSANMSTSVTPVPTYSWDVMVFAHEMGHNLGSRHTHDCVWNGNNTQIDDCGSVAGDVQACYDSSNPILPNNGGTIMSYCHLTSQNIDLNNGFGQQPGDLIRGNVDNASCTLACSSDDCQIECPPDMTYVNTDPNNCIDETLTPDVTGEPVFTAECGMMSYTDQSFINNCSGVIERTFTFDDSPLSCFQTITIINDEPGGDGGTLQKVCGGSGNEVLLDIIATPEGGSIAVGYIDTEVDYMKQEVYVIKMDADGAEEWAYTYGSNEDDQGLSIVNTLDGGYFISGKTRGIQADRQDVLILKINSTGGLQWSNTFQGSSDSNPFKGSGGRGVENKNGGFMIAGQTSDFGVSPSGTLDFYVIKVDEIGNLMWSKTYGGSSNDWITAITPTSDGGLILRGASASMPRFGYHDVLLVKINQDSDVMWSKHLGTNLNDSGSGITEAPNGDIIVAANYSNGSGGYSSSLYKMALIRLKSTGDFLWSKTYSAGQFDNAFSVVPAETEGFLVVGSSNSFSANNTHDGVLLKVDDAGNLIWSNTYGGDGADILRDGLMTPNGYCIIGQTSSFGSGGYDTYTLKTDLLGNVPENCNQTPVAFITEEAETQIEDFSLTINEVNVSEALEPIVTEVSLACEVLCEPEPCTLQDLALHWVGNAVAMDNTNDCTELTNVESYFQKGAVWNEFPVNLEYAFELTASVYLGMEDATGADGLTFVLHNHPNQLTTIGSAGGHFGYTGIAPSISVEVDTWNNANDPGDWNDIADDHLAVNYNGSANSVTTPIALPNVEDDAYHDLMVTWDPATQTLTYSLDGISGTLSEDLVSNIFGGENNVIWGFTAGTGSSINVHQVCDMQMCTSAPDEELPPLRFIVGEACGGLGDIVNIPVTTQGFININGFQYSVHVDPSFASITGVNSFGLSNWGASDFTIDAANGVVTLTRQADDIVAGESVPDDHLLFNIEVELIGNPGQTSMAYIDGNPTDVVVSQNLEEVIPELIDGSLCLFNLATVAGAVYNWTDNMPINTTNVELSGAGMDNELTDNTGTYEFPNLNVGNQFLITPVKNTFSTNGVNLFDLIAIQLHILNIQPFTSPYQWIAGDANGDGNVSIIDIVFIERVIRFEDPIFPIGKSWRFVPADHTLVPSGNPFPIPETIDFDPLMMEQLDADFTGVKIGDVTGNADPNALNEETGQ